MRRQIVGKAIAGLLCSLVLVGCGGGGGLGGEGGSTGGGTTSGGSSGGGTTSGLPTPVYAIGALSAGTFTPGTIAIGNSPLAPGGSSGLTVDIVDTANGNTLANVAATVSFASPCAATGTTAITSPITTSNGEATTTYQAKGCSGADTITATATIGTQTLTASGIITVTPAPVSSISFTSVTPNSIRIKGTGNPQTAVAVFTAANTAGGPAAGQQVKFSLDTTAGGIAISPVAGVTDATGKVQTTVTAGTVHTSVRITATLVDANGNPQVDVNDVVIPPAQSDSLVISTGLADADSFSLSVGCFNIEGDTIDGNQTDVTVRAADRFNNPVPDGTAIAFTSEGGAIDPQCLTSGGACSVKFTTQQPRQSDHRVSLLAYAVGEESFTDVNGDGRYQSTEPFTPLGEAFLDANESGSYQSGERFIDFNANHVYDGADASKFIGVLCDSGCSTTATSLNVNASSVIIMSGSAARIVIPVDPITKTIDVSNGAVEVRVLVSDNAGQPMAGTTKVEASTTYGSIVGDASKTQPCTTLNGPFPFSFIVAPPTDTSKPGSGVFTIKVTSPSGIVSTRSIAVSLNTAPPPPPPPSGKLGSIKFISAIPTTIGIRGTGLGETSDVAFQVFSDTGVAITNQRVNFELSTTVGGIEINPLTAISDAGGFVHAIVRSGTEHTSVRVKAIATSASPSITVTALSGQLTITTGLPDQNSVSLSIQNFNPEGFDIDGTTVPVTIRAADRFNNPVPDGTAFAFTTSGGSIDGSCTTANGACSVNWVSQNPRVPRAAILAYAIGEESFTDLNGNGRYNDGEPFSNLPEIFRDDNLNGKYDKASEEFQDFNGDGRRNDPNDASSPDFEALPKFTGSLCDGPTQCDKKPDGTKVTSLYVSDSLVVTMSGSFPELNLCSNSSDIRITNGDYSNYLPTFLGDTCNTPSATTQPTIEINTKNTGNGGGQTATFSVVLRDPRDQPLPSGTTISLVDQGGDITITPATPFLVPVTSDPSPTANTYTWSLTDEAYVPCDQFGAITLTVTVPSGRVTSYQFRLILRDVTNPPPTCS